MGNLKRKSVRGYLLLESLISLVLLSLLVGGVLTAVVQSRQQLAQEKSQIEALNVARMATESGLTDLSVNGADIQIKQDEKEVLISNHGKEMLRLELKS